MRMMKPYPKLSVDPLLVKAGFFSQTTRSIFQLVFLLFFIAVSLMASAQLGVYAFTGSKTCPTQNPDVTSQPANAVFSTFSTVGTKCKDEDNVCNHELWNKTGTINLSEYHHFSITANSGYLLNLTSVSFRHFVKDEGSGNTRWILRSNIDNYTSNLASGSALEVSQDPNVILPVGSFTGTSTVTFRIYLINSVDDSNEWTIDNVTLDGSVVTAPADPGDPQSDSPQCAVPGVTLKSNGTPPIGETWYWQTTPTGTNTANSGSTYVVVASGTYYIRSQDNAT